MNPGSPTLPHRGAPEPRMAACPLRVLLADDNRIDRRIAAAILQGRGHTVSAASDGREALSLYEAAPAGFDAAVMDLQMPDMGGVELAAALRSRTPEGHSLRLIVLSGTPPENEEWRDRGIDAYLVKPIDPALLSAVVEGAMASGVPAPADDLGQRVVFDLGEALARARGKRQLVAELARIFIEDASVQMKVLREAFAAADPERIERAAHRIKGSAMNVSAQLAADVAKAIEQQARAREGSAPGTLATALWRPLAEQLEAEVSRARRALAGFLAQNGSVPGPLSP